MESLQGSVFSEHSVMAVSLRNAWTRMASTYQCINVDLTEEFLIVKPILLIGWLIFILGLDLYHKIPLTRIYSIEETGNWLSYGKVDISFLDSKDVRRGIRLYLKNRSEFISKLKQVKPIDL